MDTEQWDAENSEKGVTVRTCLNCYKRTPRITPAVTVQPSGFAVTESAHFKVCLRQRGGFLAALIHWLLTAQQVRSCRLNCYGIRPF